MIKEPFFKLVGFKTNEKKLMSSKPDHVNEELESQTDQLFGFIYRQLPAGVMDRLRKKLNDYYLTNRDS